MTLSQAATSVGKLLTNSAGNDISFVASTPSVSTTILFMSVVSSFFRKLIGKLASSSTTSTFSEDNLPPFSVFSFAYLAEL